MRTRMHWLLVGATTLAACGDGGSSPDADQGAPDQGVPDQGAPDQGAPDGGAGDQGPTDAGDRDLGPDPELMFPPGCVSLDAPIGTRVPSAAGVDHPVSTARFAAGLEAPFPTNAWWQTLALEAGDFVVNAFPYLLQTTDAGLFVAGPRVREGSTVVESEFIVDWRLAASEPFRGREIAGYDALSATVRFTSDTSPVEAPLVRGMPYVSMRYAGLTPRLESPHPIVRVNGGTAATVTGERFEVELGTGQTWVVYTSNPITLAMSRNALAATAPFSGWVRVALVPPGAEPAVLDASAQAVPTGGDVVRRGCGDAARGEIDFVFTREGEGPLLTMALPHHGVLLGPDEGRPAITHRSARGDMFGVVGDTWTMTLPLDPGGFDAPRDPAPERLDDVRLALRRGQGVESVATDPYFGGKQVAAMARLALIADALGERDIATAVRGRLAARVAPWLEGTMDRLLYDRTWGGIVAEGSLGDPAAFFGQGYYNDHHFHYGYHLYAAAALARRDPDWRAANRDNVDALARDIANASDEDPFFPVQRSLDWYLGHSNAAGLVVFGRNQESTSEAVNAWYALALWARVTERPELNLLGRLMTAQEILAAQTYWQIEEGSPIYAEPFARNRVVGILYDTRAEYRTFFGENVEFIHGIQYLPFTPVTERLLDRTWMTQAYPVAATALTRTAPPIAEGWRGFLVMARAIFAPDEAWDEAGTLRGYDDGNSETNTLWWIATRP
ncbi:MAG: glycosyl hydrolase [Myxococcota bacterium]